MTIDTINGQENMEIANYCPIMIATLQSGTETQPGITPRAVEDVFKYIRENSDREFLLRVSYMEIYNESIRDLLSPEAIDLRIHEDKRVSVY